MPELEPPFLFGEHAGPEPPDYSDLKFWSSHPGKEGDVANTMVPEDTDGSKMSALSALDERQADCFYVCGTNWCGPLWNAAIPDEVCDEWCDLDCGFQGSAFNTCCRVFAPRYRQSCIPAHNALANPKKSEDQQKSAYAALNVAFADVSSAFEEFMRQSEKAGPNRPFIVASHSQGTQMCLRLMEKISANPDWCKRLVAGYQLGSCHTFCVDRFERCFPNLKKCTGPLDIGCLIGFDHFSCKCPKLLEAEEKLKECMTDGLEKTKMIFRNAGFAEMTKEDVVGILSGLNESLGVSKCEAMLSAADTETDGKVSVAKLIEWLGGPIPLQDSGHAALSTMAGWPRNCDPESDHIVPYPDTDGTGRDGIKWESMACKEIYCVNPLTWTSESGKQNASLHLGVAVVDTPQADGTPGDFMAGAVGRVVQGVKVIGIKRAEVGTLSAEIKFKGTLIESGSNAYNHEEWRTWYFNVRDNAPKRLEAWQKIFK